MSPEDLIKHCVDCNMCEFDGTLYCRRTAPVVLECGRCMRNRLEAEVAMWRQMNAALKTEMLELKAQVGFLESQAVGR